MKLACAVKLIKIPLSVSLLVGAICFMGECLGAQITGTTSYHSRKYHDIRPVPYSYVLLLDSTEDYKSPLRDSPILQQTTADYQGEYSFANLKKGRFRIAALWDWKGKVSLDKLIKVENGEEKIDIFSLSKSNVLYGISGAHEIIKIGETINISLDIDTTFAGPEFEEITKDPYSLIKEKEGIKLYGEICDDEGNPVEIIRFSVGKIEESDQIKVLYSLYRKGKYACLLKEPGLYRIDWLVEGDYTNYSKDVDIGSKEGKKELDIVLHKAYSIEGEIEDTFGKPLQNIRVCVYDSTGGRIDYTNSNADGRYRVDLTVPPKVKDKKVKVVTKGEGFKEETRTIDFTDKRHKRADFILKGYEGNIEGKITDERGNGIAGVEIVAAQRRSFDLGESKSIIKTYSSETNIEGQYHFDNLPEGKYTLMPIVNFNELYTSSYEGQIVKITLHKRERLKRVDIIVPIAGVFKGKVFFKKKYPGETAEIYADPGRKVSPATLLECSKPVKLAPNGSFEIRRAHPGFNTIYLKFQGKDYELGIVNIQAGRAIMKDFTFEGEKEPSG